MTGTKYVVMGLSLFLADDSDLDEILGEGYRYRGNKQLIEDLKELALDNGLTVGGFTSERYKDSSGDDCWYISFSEYVYYEVPEDENDYAWRFLIDLEYTSIFGEISWDTATSKYFKKPKGTLVGAFERDEDGELIYLG